MPPLGRCFGTPNSCQAASGERLVLHGRKHLCGANRILASGLDLVQWHPTASRREEFGSSFLQTERSHKLLQRQNANISGPKTSNLQLQLSEATWSLGPALVFFSIIFCAIQTFSMGISMPKSPRATMMPSDSAKILRAQGRDTWKVPRFHFAWGRSSSKFLAVAWVKRRNFSC